MWTLVFYWGYETISLSEHLKKSHASLAQKKLDFSKDLRDKRAKETTLQSMFEKTERQNDNGLKASYNIALLIAKTGKSHNKEKRC